MANKKLESLGFSKADTEIYPRLIMSVSALDKEGKSHFALTAPSRIAYFNVDIGLEGVVNKFKGKDIMVYDMTVQEEWDAAKREWNEFVQAYYAVLEDPKVRTIVADTATEWWEMIRLARFGKTTQVMPYMYGPVNAEFRKLLKKAYSSDKNLILLHKMKETYENNEPTGEYERAGFKDIGYLVQVNCRAYREDGTVQSDGSVKPGAFHMYVENCRQNPDLADSDFTAPFNEFPMLASLILPDTGPEDWE